MAADWKGGNYQKYLFNVMALYKQRPDLKAYLEVLLSIITIAMFILFAIKPTLVTIADLWVKIQAEQATSDKLDIKIKNLGLAQTIFNKEKENIILLNQAVPTNPEVQGYIRQVEGLVKRNGVSVTTVTASGVNLIAEASQSATLNNSSPFDISVLISGTYQSLTSFINDLENLRRPSIVKKLDYNIVQVSDTTKVLNLNITTSVPYN